MKLRIYDHAIRLFCTALLSKNVKA